ncbi:MAG: hypothetical protein HF314_07790 [Ignavibacteria bacterium]|jgi:citrate lyase beta subunit|nr:hypothetical protein [Ignavibacteria bacterium]MCU7502959.1 hypothetical protein [Ignavibacteria bacterium]MCU7517058.1 hypothetical protein [Ignavibacteria bacterium]
MKSPVTVFHFTRPSKELIVEYSRRISAYGAVVCFDFEDILMDLSIHSYSEEERATLRSAIAETLEALSRQQGGPKVGVRLNSISSIHFENDLRILKRLSPRIFLDAVFLPKVEASEELSAAIEVLHEEGIKFGEIIPVIETKCGMENLKRVFSIKDSEFKKIAFGHCDFNRDNNYFPFFHQDTEKYWQWINQILSCAEGYNKIFVNSPYLRLEDAEGFTRMLMRLKGKTPNGIGQITLAENQTKMCAEFKSHRVTLENAIAVRPQDKLRKAIEIISDFENNRIPNKSISVNNKRILISPHEYAAAVEYMNVHAREYEISK